MPQRSLLHTIGDILSVVFYIIWIVIGLLFLLFIWTNIRQGAFRGLFGGPAATAPGQVQTPTETVLPGVGKVNISCVQQALSAETIQKILQESSTSTLTDEEKAQLEPCIVEKEEATPSPK